MIEVKRIESGLTITGHAGFAPHGQDIVCAGVSALAQTLIVSLESLTQDPIEYVCQPGTVEIKHGNLSEQGQVLVDSFFVGLRMIADSYPNNVKLSEHL
jgi:uncharacterized protein YsxB (DUF464 family)